MTDYARRQDYIKRRPIITEERISPGRMARASRTFCRTVRDLHITEEPVSGAEVR
jgi:hypothetical protein